MQALDGDDLFLDAVDDLVLSALGEMGKDPAARFALFKGLLAAAREATAHIGHLGALHPAARASASVQNQR